MTLPDDALARLGRALGTQDAAWLSRLAPELAVRTVAAGTALFRQGDPSDAMYVVERGALEVRVTGDDGRDAVVGRIEAGEPVGEMQILSGGRRTATVVAAEDTVLTRLPRTAVEALAREHPEALRQLGDAMRRRVRRNQLVAILPSIFGTLDEAALRDVEAAVEWTELPRGTALFAQGDEGASAFVLVSGRLQASVRQPNGADKVVGEIAHGEMVGEMALFTGEPRNATVRALRDSTLVRLDQAAFERLIARNPQALMALTRSTIGRLRDVQSGAVRASRVRSIALIAAGTEVPLGAFAHDLTAALDAIGPALHVSAAELDRLLGTPGLSEVSPDDPRAARIGAWIDDQEAHFRFVVLEADPTPSPWSTRCARHADRVLVVARAGDDPTPGPLERALVGAEARGSADAATSLVLLHPASTRLPSGTKRWLVPRRLVRHHHVRVGRADDVARVARFVAETAFGVALSGGGARGFAHVGVLQALDEAGLSVDMICGTSMGAFVSAEYALGWDPPTMVVQNQKIFGRWQRDLTFPMLSLLGGHRSGARLRESIGDIQIEDLWLPYFCVSSNLSRAEMMIHDDGPIWLALRASGGLPGIFPPVVHRGDLLVDGGFLRNLPADLLRDRMGGGTIVAVDVSAELDLQFEHSYEHSISGWRILWSRMNPFGTSIATPSLAAILQRSGEIASVAMQRDALLNGVDLYVRIPVQQFGMLDFHEARSIIETGYATARTKIAEWLVARGAPLPDRAHVRERQAEFREAIAESESA
jgi:predicted acylesterase/phospholipase RssA/CRP-like cAMP-binding protein